MSIKIKNLLIVSITCIFILIGLYLISHFIFIPKYNWDYKSFRLFSILFIIIFMFIFVIAQFFYQKTILSRLLALNRFVNETSISKNISLRADVIGNDEISNLTLGINNMLDEISASGIALMESEERLKLVFEGTNDIFWDYDAKNHTVYLSPKFESLLGYSPGEVNLNFDSIMRNIVHPEDLQPLIDSFQKNLEGMTEYCISEQRLLSKSGKWMWFYLKGRLVARDEDGTPARMVGILSDITKRKESEERIKYLTYHERLTGLYNRSYFEIELDRACSSNNLPFSIILGDINGLKLVNDSFGYNEGDNLICRVGSIFKDCCKKNDIVTRLSGDEFAILSFNCDEKAASEICNKIRQQCELHSNSTIKLSISLGTATRSAVDQDYSKLLITAEELVHRNKLIDSNSIRNSIISSLNSTLIEISNETEEHTQRMSQLCLQLGNHLKLGQQALDELVLAASLHDIGKIAIPDYILSKPGKLTAEEWDVMKTHTEVGYRIAISIPEISHIAPYILSHHEWYNGNSYPRGLKGKDIALVARMLSIVDSYDVMTNERPYKKPMSQSEAFKELLRCSGTQFDPELVESFIAMIKKDGIKDNIA